MKPTIETTVRETFSGKPLTAVQEQQAESEALRERITARSQDRIVAKADFERNGTILDVVKGKRIC